MTTAKAKAEPQKTEAVTADAETGVPDPDTKVTVSKDDQQVTPDSTTPPTPEGDSKEAQSAPQLPSVGRVVHFVIDPDAAPLAATVTAVHEDQPEGVASLVVFKEHLQMFRKNVPFDPSGKKAGTWQWPARV